MVTIAGKSLGRKKPLFADFSIPAPPEWFGGEGVTLRKLIDRVVRDQVAAFEKRQHDRQFIRALTERQVEEGAERGKIDSGGSEVPLQPVDPDTAVGAALVAFEDGLYMVVIDDEQRKQLDEAIFLQPDSRMTFVRLTLLAGG